MAAFARVLAKLVSEYQIMCIPMQNSLRTSAIFSPMPAATVPIFLNAFVVLCYFQCSFPMINLLSTILMIRISVFKRNISR
ncbi:MAG: hypothetical protein EGQ81_05880 [Akkermansia sp.]|nr:hypothetical protein [Akkermansia sp.]